MPDLRGAGPGLRPRRRRAGRRRTSLNDGAITVPNFAVDSWYWQTIVGSGLFDPDSQAPGLHRRSSGRTSCTSRPPRSRSAATTRRTRAWWSKVQRLLLAKDRESMQPHIRAFVDRAVTFTTCAACGGARLNAAALSSQIAGRNIAECSAMQISDLAAFVRDDRRPGGRAAGRRPCATCWTRWSRSGWATSAWTASRHPLRRRGAAGEDGPAPRLQPHRRHVRLRRAHRRPAPARHRRG